MDYWKMITEILLVIAIAGGAFVFGPDVSNFLSNVYSNPCDKPIAYSIGTVDSGFRVSDDYFLSAVREAEGMWEKASGKNLFEYSEGKGMKVNLIYDYRQDSTITLNNLDNVLEADEDYYNSLKSEYEAYVSEHDRNNSQLSSLVSEYNQTGFRKKNAEQALAQIRALEEENNSLVDKINELGKKINEFAQKYNANIADYNEMTKSLDSEFEQGNYKSDMQFREIDIYQFDNRETLVAVLVHEMGHALELGHVDNPSDIMYSVGGGGSQSITEEDLSELGKICSKTPWDKFMERFNKLKNERNIF